MLFSAIKLFHLRAREKKEGPDISLQKNRLAQEMKKVELRNVKEYEAPGHFKMVAMRLHGREETGTKNLRARAKRFVTG